MDRWCQHYKGRLRAVVGWDRREEGPEVLFTSRSYDVAYEVLLDALGA